MIVSTFTFKLINSSRFYLKFIYNTDLFKLLLGNKWKIVNYLQAVYLKYYILYISFYFTYLQSTRHCLIT